MESLRLIEFFKGFQGEGSSQGVLSLFIRFGLCNLSCKLCDTKHSWSNNNNIEITMNHFYKMIEEVDNVIFTGGEPLLDKNVEIIKKVVEKFGSSKTYEIETNGTLKLDEELDKLVNDYNIILNISPKSNVEQVNNNNTDPVLLEQVSSYPNISVKFLVENETDFEYITEVRNKYSIQRNVVWIQPVGISSDEIKRIIFKLENKIIKEGYNLSSRLHVLLFENKKEK